MARHCRKPKRHLDSPGLTKERTGSIIIRESSCDPRRSAADRRSNLLCRLHRKGKSSVPETKLVVSKENDLFFLIDIGADVSLLKRNKLIRTTEYVPEKKVKVKSVDGYPMETHGVIETKI